ncbi:hypothetical protein DMN91_009741 [Ooceraea biroi]|uniref:Odorant receptor n=1 Tax=Ooceraea biroi TaxID=2015173 RepID=A0A3L8DAZ3_OOCBI|nr:uncharacterized protein LOC105282309 isoform X2 [Ooceraea biroi]RLU17506.1 hypothetical protein DMN91_009741 [Ooceraea biroi]
MVFVGERCYKLQRLMFLATGLWPYQKPGICRLQAVFFFSSYCFNLLFQLTAFLTTTCNMDCILKRFTYICVTSCFVLCYCSFYCNSEFIKQALKHMQLDWKMFENSDTIKIFEEYLFLSYVFALFAIMIVPTCASALMAIECKPVILDAIIPLNTSRPRTIEVDYELFLDKEEYFFLYVMHEVLGTTIGFYSILVVATCCVLIVRHSCATHKIASCIIQNTAIAHTLQIPVTQQIQFIHRSISFSVYLHRRTLKLMKDFMHAVNLWYFPLVVICILCLSCLLLRLYNAITDTNDLHNTFVCCVLLYTCFMYMFITSFLVQSYSEHSILILKSTYDTLWYVAPVPIQKLFLFMQTSIKAHMLVLGGLFVFSMEGFSTILTTAISYFTVLNTMHS